ncbi:MAG: hypothetical protein ABEJ05_14140 [Haloglomus sp.]
MSDDEGYVHDPAAFGEDNPDDGTDAPSDPGDVHGGGRDARSEATHGGQPRGADREFDWRGWVLVVAILFAFVVIPVALYFLPRVQGLVASLGFSLRQAFLVLPLLPALVLGALAVWATTRP